MVRRSLAILGLLANTACAPVIRSPGLPTAVASRPTGIGMSETAPIRTRPQPAPDAGHADSGWDGALSVGGGVVGSLAAGIPTFEVLYNHGPPIKVKGDDGYSVAANVGLLVAGAAGAALGVHLARHVREAPSSLTGALLGTVAATLPFMLGVSSPTLPYYGLTLVPLLQGIGGWLGAK